MPNLTKEEEAEFTIINCLAHGWLRDEGKKTGTVHPCWLCMSTETRQECRNGFYVQLEAMTQSLTGWSDVTARKFLADLDRKSGGKLSEQVQAWKQAEIDFKDVRENPENPQYPNPRAFFAGY